VRSVARRSECVGLGAQLLVEVLVVLLLPRAANRNRTSRRTAEQRKPK
jgi:hypothetical protein